MRILSTVSLLMSLALLGACSSTETKEDVDLGPSSLTDYDEEIRLSTEWRHQVGKGLGNAYARLQPAIKKDVVYAADSYGLVKALKLSSGFTLWKNQFDVEITAAVTVGDKFGYIATSKGELIAFDLTTGDEAWRTNVKSEVIALPSYRSGQLAAQTIDGHLYLLDGASGAVKWRYDSNLPSLSLRGTSEPLFHGPMVIAGFANGKVVGVNASDGSVLWQERIGIPAGRSELERLVDIDGRLLVEDDLLYVVGYQGHIAAIDLRGGKMVWKQEASSYHGPLAGLGNLYVVNDKDHVVALDDRSASDVWQQVSLQGRQLSEPVMFAKHIAVADYQGYLHLIKQLDGTLVGRDRLVRPPVDRVKTGSYDLKHPSREFSKDPGIRTRLLASDEYLIAISNSGYITAYTVDQ